MKKFKLTPDNRKSKGQADGIGTVVVTVFLASKGHRTTKGNIIRHIRLDKCKVSEVFKAIENTIVDGPTGRSP